VIQVGAPVSRDIYIHRVGRTGRAGADGSGVLVLAPFEKNFLKELYEIPIQDHNLPESELETGPMENKVLESAKSLAPDGMIEEVFMALLGYCTPIRTQPLLTHRFPQDEALGKLDWPSAN
jgi:ATP-dependent RNA helicase MSS116, mitochondrial